MAIAGECAARDLMLGMLAPGLLTAQA